MSSKLILVLQGAPSVGWHWWAPLGAAGLRWVRFFFFVLQNWKIRLSALILPISYESNQLSFISLNIAITVVLISSHEQNRAFFFSVCVQYIVHTIAQGSKNLENSPINNCVRSRYFIFRWKFLFLKKHISQWLFLAMILHYGSTWMLK